MPRRKKRFGQHHLRHPGLCRPLVEFLGPRGARVVEIGPGGGVLTGALVAAGARVLALEIDPEWAFGLRRRIGAGVAVAVLDAMRLEGAALPAPTLLAGNLPFQIATPFIERVVGWQAVPRAAFLVQLEVGRRLVAAPGSPDYGALSVLTAARAEVTLLGRVDRRRFRPVPAVDGVFVGLERRPPPLPEARMGELAALVRLAFAHRRKTLRNALGARWPRAAVDGLLAAAGLDPRLARAESLDLAAFVRLLEAVRERALEPADWS